MIATATNTVTDVIYLSNSPVAFGIFTAPLVAQAAPPSGTTCNGVYNGTFTGNVIVSGGQNCTFINGGQINGNVNVIAGNFALKGAKVSGNLAIIAGTFTLATATIDGNLQIQNIPPGSASNSMCSTTVYGNLQFDDNGTPSRSARLRQ